MTTRTATRKPAPTKSRTLRIVENGDTLALVITETTGNSTKRDAYFLQPIASGFAFNKDDGTRYHTSQEVCSCPGHKYHSKTVCKHRAAVQRLVALGRLKIVDVK